MKKIIGILFLCLLIGTSILPENSGNHFNNQINQSQQPNHHKNTSSSTPPPLLCSWFLKKANDPDTKHPWFWFFLYEIYC